MSVEGRGLHSLIYTPLMASMNKQRNKLCKNINKHKGLLDDHYSHKKTGDVAFINSAANLWRTFPMNIKEKPVFWGSSSLRHI